MEYAIGNLQQHCSATERNRLQFHYTDFDKPMDLDDLNLVTECKTPRKRSMRQLDGSGDDGGIHMKKARVNPEDVDLSSLPTANDNETMVVVELAPMDGLQQQERGGEGVGVDDLDKNDPSKTSTTDSEYFEFIKSSGDEFGGHGGQLVDGLQSKSSTVTSQADGGDREGLASGQQYYIAVDARTVATLQAGAEYTLVPIDQTGKGTSEERSQGPFDEDSCRMWGGGDGQLKNTEQPQQLLIQTMRPLSSNPSSPQLYCQEDGQIGSGQTSDTDGLGTPGSVYSTGLEGAPDTPNRKLLQPLQPVGTGGQAQGTRGCNAMGALKFDTPNRFQTPTTATSPANYPVMPTPHPHMMYSVPPPTSHHPTTPAPFGYAGHRVHLPPPGPAWHSSPYSQPSYSSHNTPSFVPSSTVAPTPTMSLNSSGEEQENVSPGDYPRVPHNTPNAEGGSGLFPISAIQRTPNMAQILGPLDNMQYFPIPYTGRENHNEKERKRRSRIKNACSLLRDLVPGLSEKTDKATVFEYTVQYLLHLKRHVGKQFDKELNEENWNDSSKEKKEKVGKEMEFMEKYTPY